jgi:hypothetical protein
LEESTENAGLDPPSSRSGYTVSERSLNPTDCSEPTNSRIGCAGFLVVRITSISPSHRMSPDHALGDSQGQPRATIKENADGQFVVGLLDTSEQARAVFGLDLDGSPLLTLRDESGENRITLLSSSDNTQAIMLHDEKENLRLGLYLDSDSKPSLYLTDNGGRLRSVLRVGEEGHPSLYLLDEKQDLIWEAP